MSVAGADTDLGEPGEPERLDLATGFPQVTRERWETQVLAVLRKSGRAGEDTPPAAVEDLLTTVTYDGIGVRPLYTPEDRVPAAGLPGLAPFVRGRRAQGAVVDGWDVRARHAHPDPKVTADAVIADLETGVTSLWLVLGPGGLPVDGLRDALKDVYLDLAPVVLDAGAETAAAAAAFLALADDRGIAPTALLGSLGADPLGVVARTGDAAGLAAGLATAADLAGRCAREFPQVRAVTVDALPYSDAGGSDAQELGASIAAGVAYLRSLTDAGLSAADAFREVEFRYAASADQFSTIAKLRAARRLWARVGEVVGVDPALRAQHQHAVTAAAMMTRRDPWVNMLRTTLACFGAGVGGADAVTVLPFDSRLGLPDDFSRRIARNTQILLQEESSLIRVVDPAGGSWYVERLTADLAGAGWAFFTEIERAGGAAAVLASGWLRERLDETWSTRLDAIAHRRDEIIGVSEFPNVEEALPARRPAADRPGGGLPVRRYAAPYEDLRDRADAAASRPTVFLATLGSIASSSARTSFAANLFGAGGLATTTSGPGTDAAAIAAAFRESGARVACLCGADRTYGEHAATVAAALHDAGATRIWLAGKPGDRDDTGVDGYLYTGCDALDVLTTTLTDLGVA